MKLVAFLLLAGCQFPQPTITFVSTDAGEVFLVMPADTRPVPKAVF